MANTTKNSPEAGGAPAPSTPAPADTAPADGKATDDTKNNADLEARLAAAETAAEEARRAEAAAKAEAEAARKAEADAREQAEAAQKAAKAVPPQESNEDKVKALYNKGKNLYQIAMIVFGFDNEPQIERIRRILDIDQPPETRLMDEE